MWYKSIQLACKSDGTLAIQVDVILLMQGTKFTQCKLTRKPDLTETIWETDVQMTIGNWILKENQLQLVDQFQGKHLQARARGQGKRSWQHQHSQVAVLGFEQESLLRPGPVSDDGRGSSSSVTFSQVHFLVCLESGK